MLREDLTLERIEVNVAGGQATVYVAARVLRDDDTEVSNQQRSASFQLAGSEGVTALLADQRVLEAARRAVGDPAAVVHLPGRTVTKVQDRAVLGGV